METVLAADAGPSLKFPTAARERIAIASYPFRDFIAGRADKAGGGKMELKEFAAHVSAKFNIKKIEPWSAHFRSLEKAYLEELRTTVAKAGGAIVNIAVDDEYAYKGIEWMFGLAYGISHVKETEVGDGNDKIAHVDLAKTFGIAKKHGYKGYFSMEWDSPGDPYAGTADLIEKTVKNLS